MSFFAITMMVVVILRKIIYGDPVAGWASTICVIVFIGGLQLFCPGIIGQYLAKAYLETKHRPHFIVAETNAADVKQIQ